jgi:hypothetical protein
LVVTTFQTTGPGTIVAKGQVELPIRVVIKNQGGVPADIFKVSAEYKGAKGGMFLAPFTVPGQGFWYPYTNAPLAVGRQVTFEGKVTFSSALQGEIVALWAIADSCAGEESVPDYCRVQESNEDNNESASISVSLPYDSPPRVTVTNPSADSGTSDEEYASDGYDEKVGLWYADVVLRGSATDPEDGALSGSSLVWTTDRMDIQNVILGTGTDLSARLYLGEKCTKEGSVGDWHEIALTGRDSGGKESTAVRRIFIWISCIF